MLFLEIMKYDYYCDSSILFYFLFSVLPYQAPYVHHKRRCGLCRISIQRSHWEEQFI